MVDALLKYVEDQLAKGYQPNLIKDRLVRQGYSPSLVDGIIESVMMQQGAQGAPGAQQSLGVGQEKSAFPKIILVIFFIGIIVAGIIFVPKLLNPQEPLLDVKVSSDKQLYYPGDEVGFDLEITNMGSTDRFDTTLIYRLLSSNDNTLLSNEETLAISTSTSHHRTITLPSTIKPGSYVLKVFANYAGKVAVSSFSFDVAEKTVIKETCNDKIQNQDETNVDCGGVCASVNGAYWYDTGCHANPKPGTQPTGGTCVDGIQNQDETNVDCGGTCTAANGAYWYDGSCHSNPQTSVIITGQPSVQDIIINATATAATNPEGAKSICMQLETSQDKDACFEQIAQISNKQEYCELIVDSNTRDLCYKPFFFEHKDFTVCEKLTDPENKKACEQLREIQKIMDEMNNGNNETAAQTAMNSTTNSYFND